MGVKTPDQELQQRVLEALQEVRPFILRDGGDVTLVKIEQNQVYIQFHGACVGCPFSLYTLSYGIEREIKSRVPEITRVIPV